MSQRNIGSSSVSDLLISCSVTERAVHFYQIAPSAYLTSYSRIYVLSHAVTHMQHPQLDAVSVRFEDGTVSGFAALPLISRGSGHLESSIFISAVEHAACGAICPGPRNIVNEGNRK